MRLKRIYNAEEIKTQKVIQAVVSNIRKKEYLHLVKTPSLRGMILGSIYEYHFHSIMKNLKGVTNTFKPDDHDRKRNKSDLIVTFNNKTIRFQLKSIETDSIRFKDGIYYCSVQNDASDRRKITLPNSKIIETSNYKFGDYDILAVCLMPFTEHWDFCFKLNSKCQPSKNPKIEMDDRKFIMNSSEKLQFPLDNSWTTDIFKIMNDV